MADGEERAALAVETGRERGGNAPESESAESENGEEIDSEGEEAEDRGEEEDSKLVG
jgi:hypothetical protein